MGEPAEPKEIGRQEQGRGSRARPGHGLAAQRRHRLRGRDSTRHRPWASCSGRVARWLAAPRSTESSQRADARARGHAGPRGDCGARRAGDPRGGGHSLPQRLPLPRLPLAPGRACQGGASRGTLTSGGPAAGTGAAWWSRSRSRPSRAPPAGRALPAQPRAASGSRWLATRLLCGRYSGSPGRRLGPRGRRSRGAGARRTRRPCSSAPPGTRRCRPGAPRRPCQRWDTSP
mmetsp:Transcript_107577/g.304911  ORF Transcript_107577/g.304911 Transcript_107577/m.304911 type:complete len:231 (+) Transcript_107577:233-925(+)